MVGARWGLHYGVGVVVLAEVVYRVTEVVVQGSDNDTVTILEWHVPILLLGEGSDEFAAEVGDVWDHAAPDQVGGGRQTLEHVSDGRLGRGMNRSPSSIGVLAGVP
jgi:hypothetical protein